MPLSLKGTMCRGDRFTAWVAGLLDHPSLARLLRNPILVLGPKTAEGPRPPWAIQSAVLTDCDSTLMTAQPAPWSAPRPRCGGPTRTTC